MRLGQLSRKLSVRPGEIVAFLAKNNVVIEESANAKIEAESLRIVLTHFAPEMLAEAPKEHSVAPPTEKQFSVIASVTTTTPAEDEPSQTTESAAPAMRPDEVGEKSSQSENDLQEMNAGEENDVIRAPKVELQGLRVVGKIELPEPKKKEEEKPVESPQEERSANHQNRPREPRAVRSKAKYGPTRSQKNPVALERERLAREAEEQKKRQLEREKERKKIHYNKRVKPKGPTKAARLYEEHVTMDEKDLKEEPKSWWGKIKRWLTSY